MRHHRSHFALLVKSLFSTVPVVLVAAVLVAACGSVEGQAFEVDGRSTSQGEFDRELEALADNDQFVEFYEQTGEQVSATDGTVSAELTAQWATIVIQQEIVAAAGERDGIEVDDAARADTESQAAELFGSAETFDAFPDWFRDRVLDRLARHGAYLESSATAPSEEEARAFYDENLPALVQSCPSGKFVSHILVASEAEANEVAAELASGTAFEALARERSTDTSASQGGFIDCYQPGQLVAEFEAAVTATAVGETTAPVQTEFGWHVISVAAEPSFEALREQIESSLGQSGSQETIQALVENADVEVNPRYGSWVVDEQQASVVPPEPKVPESTEPPPPSLGTDQPVTPPPPSS